MPRRPQRFDPRQKKQNPDFELQYKRDTYLKNVTLHHHDFYEIYFLVAGDVTYLIEGKIVHVMPGDLLLISPRELHQVCIRPEMSVYERYVLWVGPQIIEGLSSPDCNLYEGFDPSSPGYRNQFRPNPEDRAVIQGLLEALSHETDSDVYGADLMRDALLTQLMVIINRLTACQDSLPEKTSRSDRTVSQVMDYINQHYSEPLSLEMLAEHFFVSKYHLSHEFNRQVGTSVYQYIQKKRLLIARQLLFQGKKPSEVYSVCGFNDYTGFYRAFKSEYGFSPRESVQFRHMDDT